MKKLKTLIFILTACLLIPAMGVQAKSPDKQIKKLVNKMSHYEEYLLFNNPKSRTVKLTRAQKAKAASFSLNSSQLYRSTDEYSMYSIRSSKLKKAGINMFGKALTVKMLPKIKSSTYVKIMDAARLSNKKGVTLYTNYETETALITLKTNIQKKSSKIYQVTKKVYWGHWSGNFGDNYNIIYTVKKNSKSAYGYVISKMKIKKTGNGS